MPSWFLAIHGEQAPKVAEFPASLGDRRGIATLLSAGCVWPRRGVRPSSVSTAESGAALVGRTQGYAIPLTCSVPVLQKCDAAKQGDDYCALLKATYDLHNFFCHFRLEQVKLLKNVTQEFSQILNQLNNSTNNKSAVITAILGNLESIALNSFIQDPRDQNISTPNVAITMKVAYSICRDKTQNFTLSLSNSSMEVPCKYIPKEKDGAVFILYNGIELVINGSNLADSNDIVVMNSKVVSGATTNNIKQHLDPPITFQMKNLQALFPSHHLQCVYWDFRLNKWSRNGCDSKGLNATHTTCICSHLSSFAVLMAPVPIEVGIGLKWVSIVGLAVSLVSLALSLLTFLLIRSLRNAHTSILAVLVGCLFLGQLLLLVGISQTWNKILCAVIAGGLHFLFLSSFCWMTLECILLFMTVRHLQSMNYLKSQNYRFPLLCVIGFGIPVVIVSVTAGMGRDGFGNAEYCWLNHSIIWSFLGPVCVFIAVNATLLIITLWLLQKKLASLNTNVSTMKNTRLLIFKSLAQLFILGPTWIIGFFQFGSGALVISYIFTVCNSLQGAYIFLVHCLLNQQVREEYCRLYHRVCSCQKQTYGESSTTSFPMSSRNTAS